MSQSPRTIVLAGAGHAHLHVAARARDFSRQGARLVLVDPGWFWYSGMATGMLGGFYEASADRLDPGALMAACGGEFIRDRVVSLDPAACRLQLASGRWLDYDRVSLNVGSQVDEQAIAGARGDDTVWPVKPIAGLWALRQQLEAHFRARHPLRVAVVGGGPSGCEMAANLEALARRHGGALEVTLAAASRRLIPRAPAGASRSLQSVLAGRGVKVLLDTRVTGRAGDVLMTRDGRRLTADLVVQATGLTANPLVERTGLPVDGSAGLRVGATLQSVADPRVFAAGDCASLAGQALPKLGVFGVRQARYLHRNLLACLATTGTGLTPYVPQKRYLAILNLGDGTALSLWGRVWWRGRASFRLKHCIDRRFMAGYARLVPAGQ